MIDRRTFSKMAMAGAAMASVPTLAAKSAAATTPGGAPADNPAAGMPNPLPQLWPIHHVRTHLLDIAYHEAGPVRGMPVILGHGWPCSPAAYEEVMPALAKGISEQGD